MERHIVDAIEILGVCYRASDSNSDGFQARLHILHAVKYLANPDRYKRSKWGPSNTKGGKRRATQEKLRNA